jgi:small nuclear ribonucleoprotein (snRNP)-like protein
MHKDLSNQIYNDFFLNNNREVIIKLKDNSILKGVLIGYYKDEEESEELYILKWHIVDKKDAMNLGLDSFGAVIGNIINQKDIVEIKLSDDKSLW